MAWRVEMTDTARRQLSKLDRRMQVEIVRYLRERLVSDEDPRRFGRPLHKELSGLWRHRIADYRVICNILEDKKLVLVVHIGHRSKVYGGH